VSQILGGFFSPQSFTLKNDSSFRVIHHSHNAAQLITTPYISPHPPIIIACVCSIQHIRPILRWPSSTTPTATSTRSRLVQTTLRCRSHPPSHSYSDFEAVCDQYLCPDTLSCVGSAKDCPCPFGQDKCALGKLGDYVCVSPVNGISGCDVVSQYRKGDVF
jgi:hypothetical protein